MPTSRGNNILSRGKSKGMEPGWEQAWGGQEAGME